jgi:hypothetical protein
VIRYDSIYRHYFKTGKFELRGVQSGVRLEARASGVLDKHIIVQLLGEDDGNWFKVGNGISSFWLDDLIEVLQKAKSIVEAQEPDMFNGFQYGYKFK